MNFTRIASVYLMYIPPYDDLPARWINVANCTSITHHPERNLLIFNYTDSKVDVVDLTHCPHLLDELQEMTDNYRHLTQSEF